jgi:hypothetical protein
MKTLLLTVLTFGLLSSSAFAQEGLEKNNSPVSLLLEQTSGSAFTPHSIPIALPGAKLISVSPSNLNMAAPRLHLKSISPRTQKNTSAPSAMTIRFVECRSIISQRRNTSAAMN